MNTEFYIYVAGLWFVSFMATFAKYDSNGPNKELARWLLAAIFFGWAFPVIVPAVLVAQMVWRLLREAELLPRR